MHSRRSFFALASSAISVIWPAPHHVWAGPSANRAGVVDFVSGDGALIDGATRLRADAGAVVYAGQTVQAGRDSEVHIVFDDGGHLAVRPSSAVRITQAKMLGDFDDILAMSLLRGAMRSITGWVGKADKSSYQLRAGTATIGIRGTDHEVTLITAGNSGEGNSGVHSWVNEGGTTLRNAAGSVNIEPEHAAWAGLDGRAPQRHPGGVPLFLLRLRTGNEERINAHGRMVRDHIERRLRERGLIRDGEHVEDFVKRHPKAAAHLREKAREQRQERESWREHRHKREP